MRHTKEPESVAAHAGQVNSAAGITLEGLKTFRGCIFDFDGVVVDTERYHHRSWYEAGLLAGYRLPWEEYLPLKGTGLHSIVDYLCDRSGNEVPDSLRRQMVDTKLRVFDRCVSALSEEDIVPGIREFLEFLIAQNVKTAVGSSSRTSFGLAQHFGLDVYFQVFIDGNEKLPRKPAPDTFLLAAQRLELQPSECVVFEDSLAGVEAACNAGMAVVAVGGIRSEKAMLHIEDFRNIRNFFTPVNQ